MPCGKTHFNDSVVATAIVTAVGGYYVGTSDFPALAGVVAGCVVGTFVTPDLDLGQPIYGNWVLRDIKPLNGLLRLLSVVYGGVSEHRGMSHWPVVGTLSRLLLLVTLIYLIPCIYVSVTGGSLWLPPLWTSLWAVFGCCLIDTVHIAHDHLWSWVQKDLPGLAGFWKGKQHA